MPRVPTNKRRALISIPSHERAEATLLFSRDVAREGGSRHARGGPAEAEAGSAAARNISTTAAGGAGASSLRPSVRPPVCPSSVRVGYNVSVCPCVRMSVVSRNMMQLRRWSSNETCPKCKLFAFGPRDSRSCAPSVPVGRSVGRSVGEGNYGDAAVDVEIGCRRGCPDRRTATGN